MKNKKMIFLFTQLIFLMSEATAQAIVRVNEDYLGKLILPIETAKDNINIETRHLFLASKHPEIVSSTRVEGIQDPSQLGQPLMQVMSKSTANPMSTQTGLSAQRGDTGTPNVVPIVVGTATSAPATSTTTLAHGQATVLGIERLALQPGQRLSVALGIWLKSQSIALSWEPAGTLPGRVRDVVIDSAWLASQTALEPTLSEVLAPFGLTAHILRQRQTTDANNVTILDTSPTSVVVRNASNARP